MKTVPLQEWTHCAVSSPSLSHQRAMIQFRRSAGPLPRLQMRLEAGLLRRNLKIYLAGKAPITPVPTPKPLDLWLGFSPPPLKNKAPMK